MKRPSAAEHPVYFKNYIDLVKSDNILKELENQLTEVQQFVAEIPKDKEGYAYAPGKWTIKEVIGHIADTERVMAYRALRFSRKDKTELPGFDENLFVANADFNKRTLADLTFEFVSVRSSNLLLFKHFSESVMDEVGVANGKESSVRAVLFMMAGHVKHHLEVIQARYLGV